MEEKEDKKYDLNVRRHASHRKSFPLSMVIKILLGIGVLFVMYFLANRMADLADKKEGAPGEIEVETGN